MYLLYTQINPASVNKKKRSDLLCLSDSAIYTLFIFTPHSGTVRNVSVIDIDDAHQCL